LLRVEKADNWASHLEAAPTDMPYGDGPGLLRTEVMTRRMNFCVFCSERDHKAQNFGCVYTARGFHTAWIMKDMKLPAWAGNIVVGGHHGLQGPLPSKSLRGTLPGRRKLNAWPPFYQARERIREERELERTRQAEWG
jgi:hypothetical protein